MVLAACTPPSTLPLVPALRDPPASVRAHPRRPEVAFHCSQADAEVLLDGVPQGSCEDYDGDPKALGVGQGGHRVAVRKPGFFTWQSWLEADGTRLEVDVTLVSVTGGSTP